MSTIDPTSQSQLDSILKKLGVQKEEDGSRGNKDTLGQSDFLKLMTTQLRTRTRSHRWRTLSSLRRWRSSPR
ncbi:MAG: hypothetical protein CM15mP60_1570 [Alphaproteobacteria bacterium]|nr:MAG: hypothetical protein CM15mP60_1570 [Alphaproteobacteria bacterium]